MSRPPIRRARSTVDRSERQVAARKFWSRQLHAAAGLIARPVFGGRASGDAYLARLREYETRLTNLTEEAFSAEIDNLRQRLRRGRLAGALLVEAFAVIREAARRATGLRMHDCQMLGGRALLYGRVAEMRTGEGKTLTATLPAAAAALSGVPVHIVTVNDYLAERDAVEMRPVYAALGLSVGVVIHGMEPDARRAAYACDIVYATNKELAFDYLRDRLALREVRNPLQLHAMRLKGGEARADLLMRGLHFAIVDEVDSVLMDESQTPLIISAEDPNTLMTEDACRAALEIASEMRVGADCRIDAPQRSVQLTESGADRAMEMAELYGVRRLGRPRILDLLRNALSAQHLYLLDRDYLISEDDKVQIIDPYTGRVQPDRSWSSGLHQMIEVKEGVALTRPRETLAKISFQRFFRQYHHLAGMTGTAGEVASELWAIYGLIVKRVPPNKPVHLAWAPPTLVETAAEKWRRVAARAGELHANERPVLIGTRTVADSEAVSAALTAQDLPHRVLNARQDKAEADIVAEAGALGRITVATNMAGRGTDIKLAPGVVELGGLSVILTEMHETRRLDRQLAGRAARQGDPGGAELFASLEDPIFADHLAFLAPLLRGRLNVGWRPAGALLALRWRQGVNEGVSARRRARLLRADEAEAELLAVAGETF